MFLRSESFIEVFSVHIDTCLDAEFNYQHATYHHSGTNNMKSRGIIVYQPILQYILSAVKGLMTVFVSFTRIVAMTLILLISLPHLQNTWSIGLI